MAALIGDRADVAATGLQVWTHARDEPHDLAVEVSAIWRLADEREWPVVDLFGFSAGATVALASALERPERVRTLALLEPASTGDDEWSVVDAARRRDLAELRGLPVEARPEAFNRLVLHPGEPLPRTIAPAAVWDFRNDLIEDALAATGFTSGDLSKLDQPTLVLTGDRSATWFASVAERLVEVMPHARAVTIPGLSHLNTASAAPAIAELLLDLWKHTG